MIGYTDMKPIRSQQLIQIIVLWTGVAKKKYYATLEISFTSSMCILLFLDPFRLFHI